MRRLAGVVSLVWLAGCRAGLDLPAQPQQPGPGSLSGRVVTAVPGSARAAPVAGAVVELLRSNVSARTGDDGRFVLSPIPTAEGEVRIALDEDGDGLFERAKVLGLAALGAGPDRHPALGDVPLRENAAVRGRAVPAARRAEHRGQAGTAVFVPGTSLLAFTGDDGGYLLEQLPEGTGSVAFFRAGHAPASLDGLALRGGETLELREVVLDAATDAGPGTGTVSGEVALDPPGDASAVSAKATCSGEPVALAVSSDGAFSGTLPAGLCTLSFALEGGGTVVVPNVLVSAGADTALGTVVLARAGEGQPTADAGTPLPPEAVISSATDGRCDAPFRLDGSASTAPDSHPLHFLWTQTQGPLVALDVNDGTEAARPTFLAPPSAATVGFDLRVTDTITGLRATASTVVSFAVQPPRAVARGPAAVRPGATVQLDGSLSEAAPGATLSWRWEQTAGAAVALSANDSVLAARPTFTAPDSPQRLAFELVVTDAGTGLSDHASIEIAVAAPPVAVVVPASLTIRPGATFTLDGRQSRDPNQLPLSYEWSISGGGPALAAAQRTQPVLTLTAPAAAGSFTASLRVSNGVLVSDPAACPVEAAPDAVTPPVVSAGPDLVAQVGSLVELHATAQSVDATQTITFSWEQTGGDPVTLLDSTSDTASFTAPSAWALLSFRVTATGSGGGAATDDVQVEVRDLRAPRVVATDPAPGLEGSWLYARVTFDKALDAATVLPTTVFLQNAAGDRVPAKVRWDAASLTATVLPKSHLAGGASYVLRVDGVRDQTPARNAVSPPFSLAYTVRSPQMRTWKSPDNEVSTGWVHPGVGTNGPDTVVVGTRTTATCSNGTWFLTPGAGADLVSSPTCETANVWGGYAGRKVFVTARGAIHAVPGAGGALYKRVSGAWQRLGDYGITTSSAFAGTNELWESTGADWYLSVRTLDLVSLQWGYPTEIPEGTNSPRPSDGAHEDGRTFVAYRKSFYGDNTNYPTWNGVYLSVRERNPVNKAWEPLGGGAAPGTAATTGEVYRIRSTFVGGQPFVAVVHSSNGTRLSAAWWLVGAWLVLPDVNAGRPLFWEDHYGQQYAVEAKGRGAVGYVAFVSGTRLYVRRVDLSGMQPAFEDVPGPDRLDWNLDESCQAAHPEMSFADDALWFTWQERCTSLGGYRVALRKLF